MGDLSGLVVSSARNIPGLAETFDREPEASRERRVALLVEAAAEQGVGVPTSTRGLPDTWQRVVDVLLRRKVREVTGPFDVPTNWLSFHVPPAGKGQLRLSDKAGSAYGFKLKAVGSGWGSGQDLTISVNRDFQERVRCFQVTLALSTRVTLYEGDVPPRADVLGLSGMAVEEWLNCPDCSGLRESEGAMVAPSGEWIDLRGDNTGYIEETEVEIVDKGDLSLALPFQLPGMDVHIAIDCSRRSQLTCSARYEFPGGRRYQPCILHGEPPELPFWRWE